MELNINFNKKIEPLINSSEALSEWFEKNQERMAYYDLVHPGCNHFENSNANFDVKVLGRMANHSLTWLETEYPYSDEEKVQNATMKIAEIYEEYKERLSDVAKEKYFINVEGLEKKTETQPKVKKIIPNGRKDD